MASIEKRTTSTGESRYDVRWRLSNGRPATKTFRRRKDADDYRRTVEADQIRYLVRDRRAGRTPLSAVTDAWLVSDPTKRASSIARDRSILKVHVLPKLGDTPVAAITTADIQRLVNGWAVGQAASTVGRQYSCLRAVFSHAKADRLITETPCQDIRLPRTSLVDRPILATEDLERLATALGPDQAAMMWLGVIGGLRWAECAGLTVAYVDPLAGAVAVEAQLGRDGNLGPPKSRAGRRRVSVPGWLSEELAGVLARRGLTAADSGALVFVDSDGGPLDYTNWRPRIWVDACEKAGLPGLHFHDLRSMAASALVAAGVDLKTAQTRLGHSSAQMTLAVYARATVEADQAAAEAVGRRLRPRDGRAMEARPGRRRPRAS